MDVRAPSQLRRYHQERRHRLRDACVDYFVDEDLPYTIAPILRRAGLDVLTTRDAGRNGVPDAEQLAFAAAQGRCLVSRNYRDFIRITGEFLAAGQPHAGVLLVPRSLPNRDIARLAAAVIRYEHQHPEGMPPYMVGYLVAGER